MLRTDFIDYGLDLIDPDALEATGADLGSIQLDLIVKAQALASQLRRPLIFVKDGLTTGDHRNPLHGKGLAMDYSLDPKHGPIKVLDVFKAGLEAGFRGMGFYWDGKNYFFHFDLRSNLAFWTGLQIGPNNWDYYGLIIDPKSLKNKMLYQLN